MSDERKIIDYGVKSYPSDTQRWYESYQVWGKIVLALLLLALLVGLFFPAFPSHPRPVNSQAGCLANLRQINAMMQTYAINERAYPDSLATLAMSKHARQFDTLLCCPATTAKPASMPTTQTAIAALSNPANCSYIYLPPTTQPTPNQILLLDRTAVHSNGKFANVLTGSGTVRSISATQSQSILQQIKAGQTKILLPP